jgi:hypothetical protein
VRAKDTQWLAAAGKEEITLSQYHITRYIMFVSPEYKEDYFSCAA